MLFRSPSAKPGTVSSGERIARARAVERVGPRLVPGADPSLRPPSRPLSQAVSFSTPFGLDSDVDVVMGDPVLLRSVSSDSLGPPRSVPARTPTQPPPETGDLPTIEEALQIIHSAEPRLLPDGAADGSFYLHSPEGSSKLDRKSTRLNSSH